MLKNNKKIKILKNTYTTFTVFFMLMCAPLSLEAETENLLSIYLTRVLKHNPELVAARSHLNVTEERVNSVRRVPNPRIFFNKGFQNKNWHYELIGTQSIPWPGTYTSESALATHTQEATQERYHDLVNDVLMRLRSTYARLYTVAKKIQLRQENNVIINQAYKIAVAGYVSGTHSQITLLALQLEAAEEQERIDQLHTAKGVLQEEMGALLNLPVDSISVPTSLQVMAVPAYTYAVQISLKQNPEVASLQHTIEAAHTSITLAKQRLLPRFVIGTKYESDHISNGSWHLLTGMSLPLGFSANQAEIRLHKAEKQVAEDNLKIALADLRATAGSMHRLHSDAVRQIAVYDTTLIPLAEQSLHAINVQYQTGSINVSLLLEALRKLTSLQIQKTNLEEKRERIAADIVLCCLGQTR